MRRSARWTACLACCAWLACVACAATGGNEPHPKLSRLWRQYQKLPDFRALALAGDPDGIWLVGVTGGHESPEKAEEVALGACLQRRAARRLQAPCRPYARGDEIVWQGP